ncbi:MAG TPA: hypothetical protein VLT61_14525 [Anaeromyxobacteraceae bacterium]|nr:hypothetical protein [Anaeromyxobacteraceae bacterium]
MNWMTCPGCGLKHSPRPDGLCPRCRTRISPAGAEAGGAPAGFPGAARDYPMPPSASGEPGGAFPTRAAPQPFPTTPVGQSAPVTGVTVGSLVSRTFSTWWANVARYALLLLLAYVPIFVAGVVAAVTFGAGVLKPAPGTVPTFPPGLIPIIAIAGLVTLVIGLVLFGGMTYGALQHLAGRKVTLGAMIGAGLRRAWPLFLVGLAAYLLVLAGFVALVVPGILIGMGLSVILPVVVAEESAGVGAAIKRSFALTKGSRGTIFGAAIVVLVAMWAVSLIGNVATAALAGNQVLAILGLVLSLLLQIAMTPLSMILSAVAYHDLRVAKEGVDTSSLAAVFD